MSYFGDYDTSAVIYGMFTTYRPSTGAAYTLAGTPVVRVYKNGSTTQHTTTYSVTTDFDTLAGLNYFTIDTSADGTFFSAGGDFTCVLEAGTVDSVSVVGTVVGKFGLRKDSSLKPATAGRTLVVDAAGLADANVVKVGPSGSGTAQTAGDIIGDTNDIQTRLPAALISGRMDATVGAMQANVLTAAATATDFGAEIADAVWDEAIAGHLGAGSTGAALNAAGAAGDPWTTPLPGAYGAGTAGYIIGTNLDFILSNVPTANENADALLGRNIAGGSSTGRIVSEALYPLRNLWTNIAGTYTVYQTDDTTISWTSSLTTDAAALPITGSNP